MGAAMTIDRPRGVVGDVYLIHMESPIAHAHHYIGWAVDVEDRCKTHARGAGSPLLRAANERGIAWKVARVWRGADRNFERRLKRRRKAKALCPVCRGEIKFRQLKSGKWEVTEHEH